MGGKFFLELCEFFRNTTFAKHATALCVFYTFIRDVTMGLRSQNYKLLIFIAFYINVLWYIPVEM
jgi:hypothetical protein